jgi:hypothetical protein
VSKLSLVSVVTVIATFVRGVADGRGAREISGGRPAR